GDGAPDPPEPHDAECLSVDVGAPEEVPLPCLPLTGAGVAVGLHDAARRRHEEGPREVGGGLREDVRRVRDDHATALGRGGGYISRRFDRVLTAHEHHEHEGGREAMKIRPLHDRILVERLEEKEVKKGGIIIPDTAKEKPQEGKVIAVGNGKVTEDGKKIPL